jgi:DNA-binding NtrC family response regulator
MNTIELNASILIVEETPESSHTFTKHLKNVGLDVTLAQSGEQALQVIEKWVPDIILLDIRLPGIDGFETCRRLKQHEITRYVPIFLMAAMTQSVDKIKGLTVGSLGYISKPFQYEQVLMHINICISLFRQQKTLLQENEQLRQEIKRLKATENARSITEAKAAYQPKAEPCDISSLIGQSQAIIEIKTDIRRLQKVDKTSVLIDGECGTGKELVARAIHFKSGRAKEPFIAVNCSAIPHELAESHLFGHVRGAFTGALNNRKGYFEQAEGGTLFLDELGEMQISLQAKLLRALEENMIMPVGGERLKPINIRVLAATNANLLAKIKAGTFRKDLYFRLVCCNITLPPLRTRKEDIALLADHFLMELAAEKGETKKELSQRALTALESYDYPGNVRELKNILERAVIYCDHDSVQLQHLRFIDTSLIPNTPLPEPPESTDALPAAEAEKIPATDKEKILASVQKQGHITNTLCRQLLGAKYNRASYLLGKMTRDGVLVREGNHRSTNYRLPRAKKSDFFDKSDFSNGKKSDF